MVGHLSLVSDVGEVDKEHGREGKSEEEATYAEFLRWKKGQSWINQVSEQAADEGPWQTVTMQGSRVRQVDTVSPVNIIDEYTYERLAVKPKLQ